MATKNLKASESSSSYEYSSSEEDEPPSPSPPASVVAAATTETKVSSSDEEEDGEQSSEEDEASSEEDVAKLPTKQTPSKAEKKIPVSSKAHKRASEGENMNATKKAKTNEKKLVPPRLWSTEDELVVLQGIVDFKTETGKTTNEDKNGFYEFIKKSISFEATLSQCIAKIGALRRKYLNKMEKGKKPSKPRDLKCFELSQKIWGSVAAEGSRRSERMKKLEEDEDVMILEEDWFNNSVLVRWIVNLGMSEESVKRKWGQVSTEKKKKMQDRWSILAAKDAESALQKSEFVNDVVSLIV